MVVEDLHRLTDQAMLCIIRSQWMRGAIIVHIECYYNSHELRAYRFRITRFLAVIYDLFFVKCFSHFNQSTP